MPTLQFSSNQLPGAPTVHALPSAGHTARKARGTAHGRSPLDEDATAALSPRPPAVRTAGDVPLLPAALEPQAGVGAPAGSPEAEAGQEPRTPRSARSGRGSAARGVWLSHGPLGVVVHSFGPALSELHSPPASAVRLWPLPAPATGNPAAPRSEALGRFPPSPLRSGG